MKPTALILLLALSPLMAQAETGAEAPVQAIPRPVVSEIVTADPVRARAFPGVIAGKNTATLGFLTSGRLAAVEVEAGDRVSRGDTLATLDQITLAQDLAAAQAAFDAAVAKATLAGQQFDRVQTLVERGVATQAQLDDARANRDATSAQVDNARASLARAQDAARYGTLTAPRDSIVLTVDAKPGTTVTSGTSVVEIADPVGRDALIDVPETFAALLPADAAFVLRRHGDDANAYRAVVTLIEPETETSIGTRRLRLSLENPPEDFRIGSLVEASYATESAPVLTVPMVAVVTGARGPGVWRVEAAGAGRRVHLVPVTLGAEIGDRVVVTGGIALGDEIVLRGVHSLSEGQNVGDRLE